MAWLTRLFGDRRDRDALREDRPAVSGLPRDRALSRPAAEPFGGFAALSSRRALSAAVGDGGEAPGGDVARASTLAQILLLNTLFQRVFLTEL